MWVANRSMKNFQNEYFALLVNIYEEIISLLENAGLTELVIDKEGLNNKEARALTINTYVDCNGEQCEGIDKLIKCGHRWGVEIKNSSCHEPDFPIEFIPVGFSFETLYAIYKVVLRKTKK
jgi:hypothetical protein